MHIRSICFDDSKQGSPKPFEIRIASHYPQRKEDVAESQSKDGVEPKSRDSSPTAGTASKINDDKRSKGPLRSSEGPSTSPVATTEEPPAAMTFKFILGVVMASIFVGIILGKRF